MSAGGDRRGDCHRQETELGHINQMMDGIEKHHTPPLLVQMDKLGKAIFAIILAMMAALFIFSPVFRGSQWASCCSR